MSKYVKVMVFLLFCLFLTCTQSPQAPASVYSNGVWRDLCIEISHGEELVVEWGEVGNSAKKVHQP